MPNNYEYRRMLETGIEIEKMAHELLEKAGQMISNARAALDVDEIENDDEEEIAFPRTKKEQKAEKKKNKAKDLAILALRRKIKNEKD